MPCIKIELEDIMTTKIERKVVGSADKDKKERKKVDKVKEKKDISPKIAEVKNVPKTEVKTVSQARQTKQTRQVEQSKQLDTKQKIGETEDTNIIKKVNRKEMCHALIFAIFAVVGVLLAKFLIKK